MRGPPPKRTCQPIRQQATRCRSAAVAHAPSSSWARPSICCAFLTGPTRALHPSPSKLPLAARPPTSWGLMGEGRTMESPSGESSAPTASSAAHLAEAAADSPAPAPAARPAAPLGIPPPPPAPGAGRRPLGCSGEGAPPCATAPAALLLVRFRLGAEAAAADERARCRRMLRLPSSAAVNGLACPRICAGGEGRADSRVGGKDSSPLLQPPPSPGLPCSPRLAQPQLRLAGARSRAGARAAPPRSTPRTWPCQEKTCSAPLESTATTDLESPARSTTRAAAP